MISEQDKKRLLKLARNSIMTSFSNENPDTVGTEKFSEKQGVFVTLHKNKQLRGCIGFPEPLYPLNKAIVDAGRAAAFDDPRFPPLSKTELDDVEIEISVLSVPELIRVNAPEEYKTKIKIGRDGLIIRNAYGSGLLLPQVPVEWEWDVEQFLKQLCHKAALPEDAWKNTDSKLYRFEAEVFSEKEA